MRHRPESSPADSDSLKNMARVTHYQEFAKHIGVPNNQHLFGVLESIFFSLFRAMAGLPGEPRGLESCPPKSLIQF